MKVANEYSKENKRIDEAVRKEKKDWIGTQFEEVETCLNKNNSKKAYQLVKELNSEKQVGKCLTEEHDILCR